MTAQTPNRTFDRTPFQPSIRVVLNSCRVLEIHHLDNVLRLCREMSAYTAIPFYDHLTAAVDGKIHFGVVIRDNSDVPVRWLRDVEDFGELDKLLKEFTAEYKCQLYYLAVQGSKIMVRDQLNLDDGAKFIVGDGYWGDELKFKWVVPANDRMVVPTFTYCMFKNTAIWVSDIPTAVIFSTKDELDRFDQFIADLSNLHGTHPLPF